MLTRHVLCASGSALNGESLVFERKRPGSECVDSLVLKVNRNGPAREHNRRSKPNSDNACKRMRCRGSSEAHDLEDYARE